MPDLIAQGPRPQDRWRKRLPDPSVVSTLGRTAEPWSVAWDERVSRQHAKMRWNGSRLEVQRLQQARNAIFYQGRQADRFAAAVGEHFVIGQTTFSILDQRVHFGRAETSEFQEQTFSANLLRQSKYKDADRRIDALGKLPDIIAGAAGDEELCMRIVNLLLQGVPQATFVAILRLRDAEAAQPSVIADDLQQSVDRSTGNLSAGLDVLHWDCRTLKRELFTPSQSLVRSATQSGESVLHVWNRSVSMPQSFTQSENIDWAFCTPVVSDACPGWAIYVAGDFAGPYPSSAQGAAETDALQDDLKFTELTATTLGALRQVRALQRRQDSLRNFFSPVVLDALTGRDADDVLAPRKTDVSVLFCDLRGFSKKSESAGEQLLELLQRVSDALGVMTHHILAGGGVVGDFHGDAAMGFWGWPLPGPQIIQQVCQAALAIRREFAEAAVQPHHPLADFRAGLGIASGPAVAGRIGTTDQVKVTVFGPVVNLASRLEAMTKQLHASILVDEITASWIREQVSPNLLRIRRVAKVLPFGFNTPVVVSELLPPAGSDCVLSDAHVQAYESALEFFQRGDWAEAFRLLHQVPAEDQVKDFLTVIIAQHHRVAPPDWQGVIALPSK